MRTRSATERGETLIELLITIGILGIAIVTIVGAMGVAIRSSDIHRKQATIEALLRNYAEALSDPGVAYVDCATTGSYPTNPPSLTVPSGYSVSITNVRYWDGNDPAVFDGSCPGAGDKGAQHLRVRVAHNDGFSKQLGFVKREL